MFNNALCKMCGQTQLLHHPLLREPFATFDGKVISIEVAACDNYEPTHSPGITGEDVWKKRGCHEQQMMAAMIEARKR